jgi:hypothetical protein
LYAGTTTEMFARVLFKAFPLSRCVFRIPHKLACGGI